MPDRTPLEIAQELASWGMNVLPAPVGGKQPIVKWTPYQDKRTDDKLVGWFRVGRHNYWVLCGTISGWICLDCDSDSGEAFWRHQLGDEVMDRAACAKTRKGHHYWFRIPEGVTVPTWSQNDAQKAAGILFDVRAEGAGAIVPPSVHESGHVYEWVRSPADHREEAPEALFGPQTASDGGEGGSARSMLSHLLSTPPDGEGGRNNWLARVAGHFAKAHAPGAKDAYEILVRQQADLLDPPLPEEEIAKLLESIWSKEIRKEVARANELAGAPADADNGWLLSGDHCLLVECQKPKAEPYVDQWADFNIRALGVVEDDEAKRIYDVEVDRLRHGDTRIGMLSSTDLADSRRLDAWLFNLGVTYHTPPFVVHKVGAGTRVLRFLESQNPPHFAVVNHLGWHRDGFICHEGVVTKSGLSPHTDQKPHPVLRNRAPYRYGFEIDEEEAVALLNEVLTFHDETVCSVFGSWWAACLLKGQIEDSHGSTLFPFMAIAAPSESGKTNGFLPMMVELSGNTVGNDSPTQAELRDSLSGNRSGIYWIDDKDSTEHYRELVRQATSGGSVSKKGEDHVSTVRIRLVNPLLLTGEALTVVGVEKASIDRAIQLELPSPVGRMSLNRPDRIQYDDITWVKQEYPDLTKAAGTLLQLALKHADLIKDLPSLRPTSGRFGEKIGILRLGARILSAMTGDPAHTRRVDEWCEIQETVGDENALTMHILPALLANTNHATRVLEASGEWPITPVVVERGMVWFNLRAVSQYWQRMNRNRDLSRTADEKAIDQQARRAGMGGRNAAWPDKTPKTKRFKVNGSPTARPWFWSAGPDYSPLIIERAEGESREDLPRESRVSRPVQRGLFLPTAADWQAVYGDVPPDD